MDKNQKISTLDESVIEALKDYEVQFNVADWDRMEGLLTKVPTQKSITFPNKNIIIASAAGLFLLIILIVVFSRDDNPSASQENRQNKVDQLNAAIDSIIGTQEITTQLADSLRADNTIDKAETNKTLERKAEMQKGKGKKETEKRIVSQKDSTKSDEEKESPSEIVDTSGPALLDMPIKLLPKIKTIELPKTIKTDTLIEVQPQEQIEIISTDTLPGVEKGILFQKRGKKGK